MTIIKKRKRLKAQPIDMFDFHGCSFEQMPTKGQAQGDCPFCYKQEHFFADVETGLWDCKLCGRSGNALEFARELHTILCEETDDQNKWGDISEIRKSIVPPSEYANNGVAYNWRNETWVVPVFGDKGQMTQLRKYTPAKGRHKATFIGSPTIQAQLWNTFELSRKKKSETTWICEGEWDAIALRYALKKWKRVKDVVVAVPGANVFKAGWVEQFRHKNVRLIFDRDQAGFNGMNRIFKMLEGVGANVEFIVWSEDKPKGYDFSDHLNETRKSSFMVDWQEAYKEMSRYVYQSEKIPKNNDGDFDFESLRKQKVDTGRVSGFSGVNINTTKKSGPMKTPLFSDILEEYEKTGIVIAKKQVEIVRMMLSTAISVRFKIDDEGGTRPGGLKPIWMFLVMDSGGGKSIMLDPVGELKQRFEYLSTLTPTSLVSGFASAGADPSILSRINGRVMVLKDFTEILQLPKEQRIQVFSRLRGAWDGSVRQTFGNGIERLYHTNMAFLAATTPAIYTVNESDVGERVLKYHILSSFKQSRDLALNSTVSMLRGGIPNTKSQKLAECINAFVEQPFKMEEIYEVCGANAVETSDRCQKLAEFSEEMRAKSDWDDYSGRLKQKPKASDPTRLTIQLATLLVGLMMTNDNWRQKGITPENWQVTKQVALDTSAGFNMEIMRIIHRESDKGISEQVIAQESGLPLANVERVIKDFSIMGLIQPIQTGSTGIEHWSASSRMNALMNSIRNFKV